MLSEKKPLQVEKSEEPGQPTVQYGCPLLSTLSESCGCLFTAWSIICVIKMSRQLSLRSYSEVIWAACGHILFLESGNEIHSLCYQATSWAVQCLCPDANMTFSISITCALWSSKLFPKKLKNMIPPAFQSPVTQSLQWRMLTLLRQMSLPPAIFKRTCDDGFDRTWWF